MLHSAQQIIIRRHVAKWFWQRVREPLWCLCNAIFLPALLVAPILTILTKVGGFTTPTYTLQRPDFSSGFAFELYHNSSEPPDQSL